MERTIITGMDWDTPPHPKSLETNLQNITSYVQHNVCWVSLMAMPANHTTSCLASPYETLPSTTNLKRERITTEAMCTLCGKDVCTTAHILGVGKVSPQQGRHTFIQDSVLCKVFEALKASFLNIKEAVAISANLSVKFEQKGEKVLRKRSLQVGILHHASDRVLLTDLNSNYCFTVLTLPSLY